MVGEHADGDAGFRVQLKPQLAGHECRQEIELLLEGIDEVLGAPAVVGLPLSGLGHLGHEILIEAFAEPVGRRADVRGREFGAVLRNDRGIGLAFVRLPIREQKNPGHAFGPE